MLNFQKRGVLIPHNGATPGQTEPKQIMAKVGVEMASIVKDEQGKKNYRWQRGSFKVSNGDPVPYKRMEMDHRKLCERIEECKVEGTYDELRQWLIRKSVISVPVEDKRLPSQIGDSNVAPFEAGG